MTNQSELFGDDIGDVLEQAIHAMGGYKRVGFELWPDKGPLKAGQDLRDMCNPRHRLKLDLVDLFRLGDMARRQADHSIMAHVAKAMGYEVPKPTNPESEIPELQRQFNRNVEQLAQITQQLSAFGVEVKQQKLRAVE